MGIEWFRDLSIIILALVTSAVLIFTSVLVYSLYRLIKSTVLLVKETSKIAFDAVSLVQETLKPLIPIVAFIKGISGGLKGISKLFKKESNEGGQSNE